MSDPSPGTTASIPAFDYSSGGAVLRGDAYRVPEYVIYLDKAVAAMRLVRLIVYAGMAAFVLLAIYGFVLIYRLTEDVHAMVRQTVVITQQMQAMTLTMANLNQSVAGMQGDVGRMSAAVTTMGAGVVHMSDTLVLMQHSATNLDRTMSPLAGTMTQFMPWSWSPAPAAPPYAQ